MILKEKFTLSNDVPIPKVGLGAWFIDEKSVTQAVNDPAEIIERHIDNPGNSNCKMGL